MRKHLVALVTLFWAAISCSAQVIPAPRTGVVDFGEALALEGTTLLVGAPVSDDLTGSAILYHYDGADWVLIKEFLGSEFGFEGETKLGWSVGIIGDHEFVLGAPFHQGGIDEGRAIIVREEAGNITSSQELFGSSSKAGSFFGWAAASDSANVFVSALKDSTQAGSGSGRVYVYERRDSSWDEVHLIDPPFNAAVANFGGSIALNQSHVFISADEWDGLNLGSGLVFVYERQSGGYVHVGTLQSSQEEKNSFGEAVSATDEFVIVGAPRQSTSNVRRGAAFIFDAVSFDLITSLESERTDNLFFAAHVGVSGRKFIVQGTKNVFTLDNGVLSAHPFESEIFSSLAISEDFLILRPTNELLRFLEVLPMTTVITAVEDHQTPKESDKLVLFPNPAQNQIEIEYSNHERNCFPVELQLFDLVGRLIKSQSFLQERGVLDVSTMRRGSYIMRATDKCGESRASLVILL